MNNHNTGDQSPSLKILKGQDLLLDQKKIEALKALHLGSEATGEVQENPVAARGGGEDADCQRGSEAESRNAGLSRA